MARQSTTRRRLLGVGGASAIVAAAGCLGPFGSVGDGAGETDGSGDRSLRLSLSPRDDTLRERYAIDLADLADARSPDAEEAFRTTLEGSAYTTQYRRPFFSTPDDPTYVREEGTYYRLGSVVVDETVETRPVLRLRDGARVEDGDTTDSGTTDAESDAVAAEELPEGDRRAVEIAHMAARARGDEGGVPWGLVRRGGYVYRSEEAVETSQILSDDDPGRVVYRETEYAIEVAEERFYEPVYRASVEAVATNPERMEAILRAKFVDARIARDALSTEESDVLRSAHGNGYDETHPYSEAFRSVLTALHERAYLDGNVENDAFSDAEHGSGMILYGDEYHEYRLRFTSSSGT
ncbi:hypothetical protein [Halorubrum cibi]|uniref:Uncharacterized protein n=1 Tax=Halorubrum cibi TaxID=413815 RepID=A0A521E4D2_9EURY|nr:hypothetical protein [Halorubrum cibi]SMO78725.1 hypothetical protein SAMN06264867_10944 [Halorubrum cibi]